jgi:rod shape-determining protein MreC
MVFIWFMIAGFIFLFAPQTITNRFQFAFARIFRWPLSAGRSISLSAPPRQPRTDLVSRRQYNQLQNHADNLNEALIRGRQKFKRLYGLYNRYVWEGVEFVVAEVITASPDGPSCELIINCGQNNGLAKGQFVLGDNSIIGTISDVSSHEARIKLITDLTSSVPVKIGQFRAVMKGSGDGLAKIELAKHKAKVGLSVVAVKPGLLDSPMKVGTVAKCQSNDEHPLLWDITVKPACDVQKLTDVAVIIINPKK